MVDGELVAGQTTREGTLLLVDMEHGRFEVTPGGSTTVRFDDLPACEKLVELWLPHAAAVDLLELRTDGSVAPAPSR